MTIVTVVKDDPEGLRRTRESLVNQWDERVEHIVIDGSEGGEGDKGDEGPDPSPATISNDGHPFDYQWQQPRGVYPAMNVGLASAAGQYVLFLNAGDVLATNAVATVLSAVSRARPLWLYGQVRFLYPGNKAVVPSPFDYAAEKRALFARGRFPSHQGTIVTTQEALNLGGFDETYRIAADYKLMLKFSQKSEPLELPDVIATFETGGISTMNWRESLDEFHRARIEVLNPGGWKRVAERAATARQSLAMRVGARKRSGDDRNLDTDER